MFLNLDRKHLCIPSDFSDSVQQSIQLLVGSFVLFLLQGYIPTVLSLGLLGFFFSMLTFSLPFFFSSIKLGFHLTLFSSGINNFYSIKFHWSPPILPLLSVVFEINASPYFCKECSHLFSELLHSLSFVLISFALFHVIFISSPFFFIQYGDPGLTLVSDSGLILFS